MERDPLMPTSTESTPPFKSAYPPLERPNFQPSVPGFLLEGASEQDRYIIEQLSLVNQYAQWAVTTEMSTHEQVLKTNGRLLRAEKGLDEAKEKLEALNKKAEVMEPLFKPLSQFMGLWDYKWFRWICYIAGFFLFTYALPYYLKHPVSIETLFTKLFGS